MFSRIVNYFRDAKDRQRIAIALTKGAAMMGARTIDLKKPSTWEFSGFSQNGEDGILDVLRSQLLGSNRYFIEIGAADGIENNSAWLVVAEKYSGLMIEGDARLVQRARRSIAAYSIGAECCNMFVKRENVREIKALALFDTPDVFSLDIDGNDYYIAEAILGSGIRPRIFVVEYNSAYGPAQSATIEYQDNFVFKEADPTHLYYGVSIMGWRNFFGRHNYRFVTVDRNGVNAFFVDPGFFEKAFLDNVAGLEFADNRYQYTKFRRSSAEQFMLIADKKFVVI